MKKYLFSILIALALIVATAVPVFAADPSVVVSWNGAGTISAGMTAPVVGNTGFTSVASATSTGYFTASAGDTLVSTISATTDKSVVYTLTGRDVSVAYSAAVTGGSASVGAATTEATSGSVSTVGTVSASGNDAAILQQYTVVDLTGTDTTKAEVGVVSSIVGSGSGSAAISTNAIASDVSWHHDSGTDTLTTSATTISGSSYSVSSASTVLYSGTTVDALAVLTNFVGNFGATVSGTVTS